jgi:two-component system response regulator FixJ
VVHVIDDEEEVRWAVETLLMSAGMAVQTHPSGLAFLDALPGLGSVGCVLTDVRMPGLDGLELLQRLRQQGFRRPVIVMTAHGDISTAVRSMKEGALDFVEKPFDDEALLAIVRVALSAPESTEASGGMELPSSRGGAGSNPRAAEAAARIAALSPREREVLDLAMDGKPNKVIGYELGISMRTVEVHRMRLMARLGVGSLAEAVRLAVWAELDDSRAELPDSRD